MEMAVQREKENLNKFNKDVARRYKSLVSIGKKKI